MIVFPNCKINLGLLVHDKREDGFHNLETIFYPVPVTDILEIIPGPNAERVISGSDYLPITMSTSGLPIEGDDDTNLCVKANHLLRKDFNHLPPVRMHLHKVIPMGAGLGGGSADGAFALRLFNQMFSLQLTTQQLIDYALQLGSDCPFFMINKACYATGRGEMLEEINLDLSGYSFLLVNPGTHINTRWAFSQVQSKLTRKPGTLKDISNSPVKLWKEIAINDFEQPVFHQFPEIGKLKESLYLHGAVYAAMSGSGSTVFGIFDKGDPALQEAVSHIQSENSNYQLFQIP